MEVSVSPNGLKQIVELQDAFCERYEDLPERILPLDFIIYWTKWIIRMDDVEWDLLKVYRDALKEIVTVATVLEGQDYPIASSLIPYLDTIEAQLHEMAQSLDGEGKKLVKLLSENMKQERWFKADLYKTKNPFNVLTLLDPRYAGTFYFDEQKENAFNNLYQDPILQTERSSEDQLTESQPEAVTSTVIDPSLSAIERRRLQRLAAAG